MTKQRSQKPSPKMTRKEALAVVHKVVASVSWHLYDAQATEEEKMLRAQMHTALRILTATIQSEPLSGFMSSLCDVCYLRYAEIMSPLVILKGDRTSYAPCAECVGRLQAEGKIESLKDWETGEVTRC